MSNPATARRLAPTPAPPRIEIVATRSQRRARPRLAYAVVTVACLFVIFAAQLLTSIAISDGAYRIDSLQGQRKELLRTQQALQEQLARLDSTQHLAMQAANLGMVPNASPYALDLETGGVFALPGSSDPSGCGGSCSQVPNALLAGMPLVSPPAPAAQATGGAPATPAAPATVEALPAPVTH